MPEPMQSETTMFLSFVVPPEVAYRAKVTAAVLNISRSELLRRALERELDRHKERIPIMTELRE